MTYRSFYLRNRTVVRAISMAVMALRSNEFVKEHIR